MEPLVVGLDESVTSETGSSMPQSPGAMFEDVAVQTHIGSEGEILHSNIEMSLCGGLKGRDYLNLYFLYGNFCMDILQKIMAQKLKSINILLILAFDFLAICNSKGLVSQINFFGPSTGLFWIISARRN